LGGRGRREAESRKQKAESRKQKAESSERLVEVGPLPGELDPEVVHCFLLSAFCFLSLPDTGYPPPRCLSDA
jgi:hypothetical protein